MIVRSLFGVKRKTLLALAVASVAAAGAMAPTARATSISWTGADF